MAKTTALPAVDETVDDNAVLEITLPGTGPDRERKIELRHVRSDFKRVIVDVTAAEILALYTTPKVIIPTPGPGKYIRLTHIIAEYSFGSAPYTLAGKLWLTYSGLNYGITEINEDLATVEEDAFIFSSLSSMNGFPFPLADGVNQPVVFVAQTSNPTGGDGTFRVIADYVIQTWGD